MFQRLPDTGDATLAVTLDGKPALARPGDTVAATLFAAGLDHCRTTPVSGAPRAPYCMMGACFDCLVEIDGQPNRQSCLVAVAEGMQVKTQAGPRSFDGAVAVIAEEAAHVE